MGKYYEAIQQFPHILLLKPKILGNREAILESQALSLVYGLSGIVMAGVFSDFFRKHIGDEDNTFILKQYIQGASNYRKQKEAIIEFRRTSIPALVPEKEKIDQKINEQKIGILSLVSLGILSLIHTNNIRDAIVKHQALVNIYRYDPLAALVHFTYPKAFSGYQTLEELLRIQNLTSLQKNELKQIFELCTLKKIN